MALKFLNKKGWHTGSLRNIENVWKAEQKHGAEQRKLEELRKQIQEERERAEFRLLQERAGLAPRQERLEFLYESGLAVGKGNSEGFKALQPPSKAESSSTAAEPSSSKSEAPGALFQGDKPQSANDAWRKLHSDPLLLIRQREQEAIARIKNNPVQMAMIRKSVEGEKKQKEKRSDKKEKKKKKTEEKKKRHRHRHSPESSDSEDRHKKPRHREERKESEEWQRRAGKRANRPQMSEEERAARLREMQLDAEVHEEQRWKRISRASERDASEAAQDGGGKNFLDAARKSMFGTEAGGSATIEESVRRRTFYLQGGSAAAEANGFRRH